MTQFHTTFSEPFAWPSFTVEPAPQKSTTIRVTFNRKLTWSERESFREFTLRKNLAFKFLQPETVVVEGPDYSVDEQGTRALYKRVADFVANEFVNVHPKAVKSLVPEVVV